MNEQTRSTDWINVSFLAGTALVSLLVVPVYFWKEGFDALLLWLGFAYYIATGLSITLGYHRLFSHRAFKASWPVKLFTLIFGAAAFENSALSWSADHRRHHKHVDHDEDPYNAKLGFLHSHIGWIFKKRNPDTSMVKDLEKDPLVMWQHRHYALIGFVSGMVIPAIIGYFHLGISGAIGGFLVVGVLRTFLVHHFTFLINSLCHMLGNQPYSDQHTARDSAVTALLTFGEGYHNFHHTFQHDYRNGIKPWHFDPTKWTIWVLAKLGLASELKRVPEEKILQARLMHQSSKLEESILSKSLKLAEPLQEKLHTAKEKATVAYQEWEKIHTEYGKAMNRRLDESKEKLAEMQKDFRAAQVRFREAFEEWKKTHSVAQLQLGWS